LFLNEVLRRSLRRILPFKAASFLHSEQAALPESNKLIPIAQGLSVPHPQIAQIAPIYF